MYRFFISAALFLLVAPLPMVGAQEGGPDADPGTIRLDWAGPGVPGPVSGPAAEAMLRGPLPADADVLAERKATAAGAAGQVVPEISAGPYAPSPAPFILLGKTGIFDNGGTPSDSTGAIGTRRYIEVVNSKVGIYDSESGPSRTGHPRKLVGCRRCGRLRPSGDMGSFDRPLLLCG